ncbi:hypothetical protein Taro_002204 [Colocasia esculenta]|uniref:CCHC-type domain-containing protein n=1 Tax=Colocasia esculenta TaxID=4460 RepID=A0A843TIF4_COLES|nr:hypothetical protein [Colocasia esculenta]
MMVEYFIRGLRVELQDAIVPLMCKTVEEAAQRAAIMERSIRTRQVGESGSSSFRLPQQTVGASKGKAPAGPSSSGFGKWGQKLKQAFKGKGRGWGGRPQFQQGRGRPEVEESQQSTARQPIVPPGYRCYNCNQPRHLIRNCPYAREYGYGRGVQQQQQPQQFQQPHAASLHVAHTFPLTLGTNIMNVTVELSSFGRPKKEKLEPHLRPLLNLVNRGVNQVSQQSIVANERPVTFASTQRTSTVDNGDTVGRRNRSSTASFLAITVGQQCCHSFCASR